MILLKDKIQKVLDLVKVNNAEQNNKKKIENLVVFLIILIVTIVIVNVILNDDNNKGSGTGKENIKDETKILATTTNIEKDEIKNDELEDKLKNILSKIEGVGKVDVLLTYYETNKVEAMYNEDSTENNTEEKDTRRTAIER